MINFSQKSWLEGPVSDPDLDNDVPKALGRQLVSLWILVLSIQRQLNGHACVRIWCSNRSGSEGPCLWETFLGLLALHRAFWTLMGTGLAVDFIEQDRVAARYRPWGGSG